MSGAQKKFLVVDDSSTVRQLIKMMLAKQGPCDVTEAVDGEDAFEKIGKDRYDLVLTDINMPRMTGLDLVRKVRESQGSDPPMVIITTMGAEQDRDKGIQLGANAYLTKPLSGNKLAAMVKSLT